MEWLGLEAPSRTKCPLDPERNSHPVSFHAPRQLGMDGWNSPQPSRRLDRSGARCPPSYGPAPPPIHSAFSQNPRLLRHGWVQGCASDAGPGRACGVSPRSASSHQRRVWCLAGATHSGHSPTQTLEPRSNSWSVGWAPHPAISHLLSPGNFPVPPRSHRGLGSDSGFSFYPLGPAITRPSLRLLP